MFLQIVGYVVLYSLLCVVNAFIIGAFRGLVWDFGNNIYVGAILILLSPITAPVFFVGLMFGVVWIILKEGIF